MLVLSRKVGEELVIGDNIRIVISRVAGNRVSLGIQAPDSVHIMRAELKTIRDEFVEKPSPRTFEIEAPIDLLGKLEVVSGLAASAGT